MQALQDFLAMNGHGIYIWASYGASLSLFVGLVVWFKWMHKVALKNVQQQAQEKAPTKRKLKVSAEK